MNRLSVFISPSFRNKDNAEGGIRRLSEALWRYLPDYGITPTMNPAEADLFNLHGGASFEHAGKPMVASCHGLHWGDYEWNAWAHETNRKVVDSLARAQAVTAPSQWVAHALTRGMLIESHVVYHGVDAAEWAHHEPSAGYVLWNKARSDPVSNPEDMQTLALHLPDVPFMSTIGRPGNNVIICGVVPVETMKPIVQRAGVYLATARETFGIGTLEALAAGVPVVGWRYGGQAEIVREGETGYLAEPGDYAALAVCVRQALKERQRLSANAVADVAARWGWPDKIARYAAVFHQVVAEWHQPRPKVSVIVTAHNLARYLPEALRSVQAQTLTDWECLIVDDASTDDTAAVAQGFLEDIRFHYLPTPENLKLSGARNYGFAHARGKHIQFLDADDLLAPDTLAVLSEALDKDSGLHIAYGHLDTISEDGTNRQRSPGWPPPVFDFHAQMAHMNQLPYAAMVRREVFERGGGYRRRAWRAEDAEMWCRLTSYGFRAEKVTEAAMLIYRWRTDSKSQQELREQPDRDGDWTAYYPWRLAGSGKEGVQLIRRGAKTPATLTPWGAQGAPPPNLKFWPVPHYQQPEVSVIIPCGPGHERYLIDAVESVNAQTFRNWECLVVNDTGAAWKRGFGSPVCGAPYARVLQANPGEPPRGAGAARNAGAVIARGRLLVFLDADDLLLPQFIEKTRAEWLRSGRLVYTDYLLARGAGTPLELYAVEDWQCSRYTGAEAPKLVGVLHRMQHAVTCLVPRASFEQCGGFDASMPGWEDWDFFIRLAETGLCSRRVPEPLFVYRSASGQRRKLSQANNDALRQTLYQRWKPYYTGEKEMGCGCEDDAQPQAPPQFADSLLEENLPADAVLLEFLGSEMGTFTLIGQTTGQSYRFGATDQHRRKYVKTQDAAGFLGMDSAGVPLFQLADRPRVALPLPVASVPANGHPALPDMSEFAVLADRLQPEGVARARPDGG